MIKQICLLAVALGLLGPLLLFAEARFAGDSAEQALPIALIATGFFAYSATSVVLFHHLRNHNRRMLVSYYLGERIVRLLLSLIALLAYLFSGRSGILLFAVNLLAYHIASLLLMSTIQIKTEKAQS